MIGGQLGAVVAACGSSTASQGSQTLGSLSMPQPTWMHSPCAVSRSLHCCLVFQCHTIPSRTNVLDFVQYSCLLSNK